MREYQTAYEMACADVRKLKNILKDVVCPREGVNRHTDKVGSHSCLTGVLTRSDRAKWQEVSELNYCINFEGFDDSNKPLPSHTPPWGCEPESTGGVNIKINAHDPLFSTRWKTSNAK